MQLQQDKQFSMEGAAVAVGGLHPQPIELIRVGSVPSMLGLRGAVWHFLRVALLPYSMLKGPVHRPAQQRAALIRCSAAHIVRALHVCFMGLGYSRGGLNTNKDERLYERYND